MTFISSFLAPTKRKNHIILILLFASFVVQTNSDRNFNNFWRRPHSDRNSQGGLHRASMNSNRDHCNVNYKYDYVQLTLMWAPGACSTSPKECRRVENHHFTIHGMWPTIKGTQEPEFCCFDNSFDYKTLDPLMSILNEYWFSYYDQSSRGLWAHEWLKHGTCSRDIQSLQGETRYFNATLQLAMRLPILQTLAKSNIFPDNNKVRSSSEIAKILMQISEGKQIQLDCDYQHDQPIPLLTGVNFCFDGNLNYSDCPSMKKRCQRQIIFPATSI